MCHVSGRVCEQSHKNFKLSINTAELTGRNSKIESCIITIWIHSHILDFSVGGRAVDCEARIFESKAYLPVYLCDAGYMFC